MNSNKENVNTTTTEKEVAVPVAKKTPASDPERSQGESIKPSHPRKGEMKKGTKAAKDQVSEPLNLKHDLDLIDIIHVSHGHPEMAKLRTIVKAMNDANPGKPAPRSVTKWKYHRKCVNCSVADMGRPNQRETHPETGARSRPDMEPGSDIAIDASGAWNSPAMNGEDQAFIISDANRVSEWPGLQRTAKSQPCWTR
jgi:hypothetical protein